MRTYTPLELVVRAVRCLSARCGGMRGAGGLLLWTRLVLLLGGGAARPELVFQVPEVLVRTAAVQRAVGTGPAPPPPRDAPPAPAPAPARADDYFVEHEVSAADARRAAQLLDLSDVAESLPGCGTCAVWEREYCLGGGVVGDHCCCERRFLPEPLPWLPHACLLGASRCRPLAASCAHYARLRDCCCLRDMAQKWKSILAGAAGLRGGGAALALAVMLALRAAL